MKADTEKAAELAAAEAAEVYARCLLLQALPGVFSSCGDVGCRHVAQTTNWRA